MKAPVPIFSELFRRIYEQDWIEDMVLFIRFATTCNLVFRTSIYGEKSWTEVHEKTMFWFSYWKCSFHMHNAVLGCMLISWFWKSARWLSRGCSTRLIFIIVKPSIMISVDSFIVVCMKVLPHWKAEWDSETCYLLNIFRMFPSILFCPERTLFTLFVNHFVDIERAFSKREMTRRFYTTNWMCFYYLRRVKHLCLDDYPKNTWRLAESLVALLSAKPCNMYFLYLSTVCFWLF